MLFNKYDAIVVGAGFSGAVIAERLASQLNKRVLVLEQRDHIAGNCFDKLDSNGIRIHQYGPHLFHTRHEQVWNYLSLFTEWQHYEHKVLASVDGKLAPVPFNLNSIEAFYSAVESKKLIAKLLSSYGEGASVPILELKKTDDADLQQLANFIYEKIFVNYTAKQWGCPPNEIDPAVTARVPVVLSRDDRYFHDKHQAVPINGYAAMINNMLSHKNITIKLNTNAKEFLSLDLSSKKIFIDGEVYSGNVFYTGMLDELFDYCQGELPYRSIKFQFEQHQCNYFQSATTINYPNDKDYTRITEFKHIHPNSDSLSTTIVKEFPQNYDKNNVDCNVPYYPIFNKENKTSHTKYLTIAEDFKHLIVLGRLAEYKYFNMDDAVSNAFQVFELYKKMEF